MHGRAAPRASPQVRRETSPPTPHTIASVETALGLLLLITLVAANAFFVAAEFALVVVDRSAVERQAEVGVARARLASTALGKLSFMLSACQLGVSVTSLVLGFVAQPTVARLTDPVLEPLLGEAASSGWVSVAIALVIATASQMVFGELVPKTIAVARPLRYTLRLTPPLRVFVALTRPVIWVLDATANRAVRMMGIEPKEELTSARSRPEIERLMLTISTEGAYAEDHNDVLARSIRFHDKIVGDALVPRSHIEALPRTATVAELVGRSRETGRSRFPVYGRDLDEIVGVAPVAKVYGLERSAWAVTLASDPAVMVEPFEVPETYQLDRLLDALQAADRDLAIVVDEFGSTAGIITVEDIIEEILGEIADEHDDAHPVAPIGPDGAVTLDGLTHTDEVEATAVGFVMGEGPYETLAGFVLHELGEFPEIGTTLVHDGWTLEVLERQGRALRRIRLTPSVPQAAERRAARLRALGEEARREE